MINDFTVYCRLVSKLVVYHRLAGKVCIVKMDDLRFKAVRRIYTSSLRRIIHNMRRQLCILRYYFKDEGLIVPVFIIP